MNRAFLPVAVVAIAAGAAAAYALRMETPEERATREAAQRGPGLRIAVMNEWRGHVFPCQCKTKNLGDSAAQIGELSRLRRGRGLDAALYVGNVFGTNPDDEDEMTLSSRSTTMRRELAFAVLAAAKPAAIVPGAVDWKDRRATDRLRREHPVVCTNATFDGPLRELEFPARDVVVRLVGVVLRPADDTRFSDAATAIAASRGADAATDGARRLSLFALCVDDATTRTDLSRALRAVGDGAIVAVGGPVEPWTWDVVSREAAGRGIVLLRSDVMGQQWGVLDAGVKTSGDGAAGVIELEPRSVDVVRIMNTSLRDPAIARALDGYKTDLQSMVNEMRRRASTTRGPFQGGAACAGCHRAIGDQWEATPHAKAFKTLVAAGKEKDLLCLPCHTTGFGADGGFLAADAEPDLAAVQCESCHGAGDAHPDAGTRTRLRPSETCTKCHDPMNSPHFQLESYLPRVTCGKPAPEPSSHK